jgi:hypothetical protein
MLCYSIEQENSTSKNTPNIRTAEDQRVVQIPPKEINIIHKQNKAKLQWKNMVYS